MSESRNSEQGQKRRDLAIARFNAITTLAHLDVHLGSLAKTERVVSAVNKTGFTRRPNEADVSYLRRFAKQPLTHNVAPARTLGEWRPLTVHAHPRQAEIDVFPHQLSMGGVGNLQNRSYREDW